MANYNNLTFLFPDVPGDVIEIGVAKGANSEDLCTFLADKDTKYYGLDTFAGYCEEDITEDVSEANKRALEKNQSSGRWNWSKEAVEARLDRFTNFEIIEGDCKETLPELLTRIGDVKLLYIDCNAYPPAIFSMRETAKIMKPGSIICIDEHIPGGETKALSDFCEENKLEMIYTGLSYGQGPPAYTIIK